MTYIEYMILVALCAACISYTICYASLFLGFRDWLSQFHKKLEELIHCPYCFCHYVILTIMFTTENICDYLIPITSYVVYNFIFTWFCIVCITSLLHCVMLIAYKPVMEYMAHRALEQFEKKRNSKNK